MGLKDKLNQLFYGLTTEDRYAEYNSNVYNNTSANNSNVHLTENNNNNSRQSSFQLNDATNFEENSQIVGNSEGVSEAILAWRHIDSWTSEYHSDLNATLSDPCTKVDISRAEEDLGIIFPPPVRASLRIHDGQEDLDSLQGTGGLFYGYKLMTLSEIVEMTRTWRRVAEKIAADQHDRSIKEKLFSPTGSSTDLNNIDKNNSQTSLVAAKPGYDKLKETLSNEDLINNEDLEKKISLSNNHRQKNFQAGHIPRQQSIPPNSVRPVYANAGWVPLVTDFAGNHIAVDLDPDSNGSWGQIILFGRDYDTKFVVAKNWGEFLLGFAKDLGNGNYTINDEEEDFYGGDGELIFKDKRSGRELPYLQALTTRVITQWKASKKSLSPINSKRSTNSNVSNIIPGSKSTGDRIVSTDITAKPNDDKNSENIVIEDKENVDKDDDDNKSENEIEEDPNKSKDIGTGSLSNDFKEIAI
ncbi:hypothetical protein WICMUC_005796 [Wickerhamomyces mucosus]|uniref:Knr4/Smi1-like domain-containing protein n=1 Tax=Wickerhamomyces mucosus TaxID=1378264 RepID=A0A9P8T373_9ASCO|nr:hypothetical protein WICMUC_005796 [Wickerhamomyces mucosus]